MTKIKELRKARRMSQAELAEMLHITQTSVSQWETGKTEPSFDTLVKMSEIFGVTIDYILGSDEKSEAKKAPAEADAEEVGKLTFLEKMVLACYRQLPEADRVDILNEMIQRGADSEKGEE